MPPTSQRLIELTVTLDDTAYNCQFITAEHIPPGFAVTSTRTETACPDGYVDDETKTFNQGTLKGEVYAATEITGITWVLRSAYQTDSEIGYKIVHFPELGPTGAIEESGRAKVSNFSYGTFAKPGKGKHPVELALLDSSGPTRPAAAAADVEADVQADARHGAPAGG